MKRKMHYTLMVILLAGCSSAYQKGEPLVAADEMKAGPGIFSGEKGGFYLVGGKGNSRSSSSLNEMNLDETSKYLQGRINQLRRDQKDLELIKSQVDKKLRQK